MLKGAVLYAKDLETLTHFYLGIGGERTGGEDGEFCIIASAETELIILQAPAHIASGIVIETPPVARSTTPIKPVFEVPSIDAILENLDDLGGAKLSGAKPWKFRQYVVQDIVDPEGNIIQLWQKS